MLDGPSQVQLPAQGIDQPDPRKTPEFRKLVQLYSDRSWRLDNLYFVTDEAGTRVPFRARPAQREYRNNAWYLDVIAKARQLGMSTEVQIEQLDAAIFQKNLRCGIIDFTLDDAKKKLKKIRFAYEHMPREITSAVRLVKDNEDELHFSNGSSVEVGTSHRGGTLQFLHVSEYGKTAAERPETAREIKTGAFNTIAPGQRIVVESTAHGSSGDFSDMVQRAERLQKEGRQLTQLDFRLHFYAWWLDPKYRLPSHLVVIPQELQEYFTELDVKYGVKLDGDQRAWYAKMHESYGTDDMKSEYPSHIGECFFNSLEGTFFKRELSKARQEQRIGLKVPFDDTRRVHTCWDKGINEKSDRNAIWFFQTDGVRFRFIDYYENAGEGIQHYAAYCHRKAQERGFVYGRHIGPHDLKARVWAANAKTSVEIAAGLGIKFDIVPRIDDKEDSIEAARRLLNSSWFDAEHCARGVDGLDNYRKQWSKVLAQWTNVPLHDWASNCFTGDTEILTKSGIVRIKDLPQTGEVLTQCGWKPYRNPRLTRKNAQLVEVRFADGLSVRCTPDHLFLTDAGWKFAGSLASGTMILSSLIRSPNISKESFIVSLRRMVIIARVRFFIARFGGALLDPFLRVVISTIGTPRRATIGLKTWNACPLPSIYQLLGIGGLKWDWSQISPTKPEPEPPTGTNRTRGESGTDATPSGPSRGKNGNVSFATALIAASRSTVSFVMRVIRRNIARLHVDTLRIGSVQALPQRADVYCLTVDGEQSFSLKNGAIVHNCADAYQQAAIDADTRLDRSSAPRGKPSRPGVSHWSN